MLIRHSVRGQYDLREHTFIPDVSLYADGSCVVKVGNTHILCAVVLQEKSVVDTQTTCTVSCISLQCATPAPQKMSLIEQHEVQAFLERTLCAAIDARVFDTHTVQLDCHILQNDGGIHAGLVSGGYLALALALKKRTDFKVLTPLKKPILGIGCGMIKGQMVMDLDRAEETQAEAVGRFAVTADGGIIAAHIGGKTPMTVSQWKQMTEMCLYGAQKISPIQLAILEAA